MIEAEQVRHWPLAYFLLRRIELSRWSFRRKNWHPEHRWYARLRALVLILGGHETVICAICGGKVGVVWWCEDAVLWTTLTGWDDGGICCVQCFDDLARDRTPTFLQWSCGPHKPYGYSEEEWRRIILNNQRQLAESQRHD